MRKDSLLLCGMLMVSVAISTVLYHHREKKTRDPYANIRDAFRTLPAHLKAGSAIALIESSGRGIVWQQGRNLLYYTSLRIRRALPEVVEDSLLLAYGNGTTPLFNPDSAGFRVVWQHRDSISHYLFAVRTPLRK